ASPVCGHVTPTATTCREAGGPPNIVRVDVDGSFFRVDESLATDHAAMLYALQKGETEVLVTARRDGEEDSAVGTYTIIDPDTVTVLARCEGDDAAQPIGSEEPILAGFPIPLEVRLDHDGAPLLGYGYDRLQASAGEISFAAAEASSVSRASPNASNARLGRGRHMGTAAGAAGHLEEVRRCGRPRYELGHRSDRRLI